MPTLGRACPREEPGGAIRVQNLDDSRRSAIHATYRASLRSSSTGNPRYPSLWVVCTWVGITGGFAPPAGRPLAPEGFGAAACASLSLLATLAPEGFGWRRPRSWGPVRVDPHRDLWYDQPRERASFRSPSGVRGCSAVGRGFHTPTGITGASRAYAASAPTDRFPTVPSALSDGLFLQPFPSRRASVLASRLCICICII